MWEKFFIFILSISLIGSKPIVRDENKQINRDGPKSINHKETERKINESSNTNTFLLEQLSNTYKEGRNTSKTEVQTGPQKHTTGFYRIPEAQSEQHANIVQATFSSDNHSVTYSSIDYHSIGQQSKSGHQSRTSETVTDSSAPGSNFGTQSIIGNHLNENNSSKHHVNQLGNIFFVLCSNY